MKKIILSAICLIASLTFATTNAQITQFPYSDTINSVGDLQGWTVQGNVTINENGLRLANPIGSTVQASVTSPELKGYALYTVTVTVASAGGTSNAIYYSSSTDGISFTGTSSATLLFSGTSLTATVRDLPAGTRFIRIVQTGSANATSYGTIRNITITNDKSFGTTGSLNYTYTNDNVGIGLRISGTGDMPDYTEGTAPWYSYRASIKRVIIDNGVTSIGNNAFNSCLLLQNITIPNSVTTIGNDAFRSCTALRDITLPNSIKAIGDYAFTGCIGPTSLYIPNSVINIGNSAFEGMTNLDYVLLGTGLKTVGERAFYGCNKLTLVKMSATDCRTFGGNVWTSCTALKTFLFTENVRTIPDNIFSYLQNGFHLRWQNGQSVEGYDDYDYNDRVAIPPTIKRIGKRAFFDTRFSRIEIPASVDTIDAEAFKDNINLYELCSEKATAPVLAGGLVFHNINKATCRLVVPASAYNSYAAAPQWRDFMLIVDPSYSNAMLKNIAVNDSPVEDFDGGVHTYYMNVPFSVSSITLNAEAAGAGSTIEGIGTFDLKVGLNVFFITVTAADGISTMTYSIGVTRAPDPLFVNAFLQSLLVDGTSVAGFDGSVYTYSMNVPYSTSSITLSAEAVAPGATVQGVGTFDLAVGLNTFSIEVTAADGVSTTTYTVEVTRDNMSVGVEGLADVVGSGVGLRFNNPVTDGALKLYSFDKGAAVEIYDLNGRKMYSSGSGSDVISVANFPRGMYVVKNGKQVAKLVKQ